MNRINSFEEAVKLLHSSDSSDVMPPYLVNLYKIIKIRNAIIKGDGKYGLLSGEYWVPGIYMEPVKKNNLIDMADRIGIISVEDRKFIVAVPHKTESVLFDGLFSHYITDGSMEEFEFPDLRNFLCCRDIEEADYIERKFGKTLTLAILDLIAYGRYKVLGFKPDLK